MPEPAQRNDVAFSRESFFSGGPESAETPAEIRVEDGRRSRDLPEALRVLYSFTNMFLLAQGYADAERTQYLLSSNDTVKLYTFDRSVTVVQIQMLLIDGRPKEEDTQDLPQFSQDGYEKFMWLYEHELKMSQSTRKNRRIVMRVKEIDYEVLFTHINTGFASQGDWQVLVNAELLVLNTQVVPVGPAGKILQGTSGSDVIATASRELLSDLALSDESTEPSRPEGARSGLARAVRTTESGVPTIGPALNTIQ